MEDTERLEDSGSRGLAEVSRNAGGQGAEVEANSKESWRGGEVSQAQALVALYTLLTPSDLFSS